MTVRVWTLVARDTAFMDKPLASQWAFSRWPSPSAKQASSGGVVG